MVSLQSAVLALALTGGVEPQTVLLDFYADWCGPCRQMSPIVERLAARYPVVKVDVDKRRDLAVKYRVTAMPTFVMLVNGRVVDRQVGATDSARLEQMCRMGEAARTHSPAEGVNIPGRQSPALTPQVQMVSTSGANGRRPSPPAATADLEQRLIASTVRLRIEDSTGQSCGTGTIIDARQGEAIILTCGHIFRDYKGKGRILVDLFGPYPVRQVTGQLWSYDLDNDVGLIVIRAPGQLIATPVAPVGYPVKVGDSVVNVGCNNGDDPTARHSRVTSLDRYMGPANIEVAGQPVEGRSGGGLFSPEGYLIGVCNAADKEENEGLYAALPVIHAELDRVKLAWLYQGKKAAEDTPLVPLDVPKIAKEMPGAADLERSLEGNIRSAVDLQPVPLKDAATGVRPQEAAALEEIRKRQAEGAEVICVIRSRKDPEAKSEILMLDNVTPEFLRQLAEGAESAASRQLTSLEIRPAVRSVTPGLNPARSTPVSVDSGRPTYQANQLR